MIKRIITDCDGVLCSGMYYSDMGMELKKFNAHDSAAAFISKNMLQIVVMTSAGDPSIQERRVSEMKGNMSFVHVPFGDKLEFAKARWNLEESAYIGDFLDDVPMLYRCKYSFVPSDAVEEAKKAASVVLPVRGGEGCLYHTLDWLHKNEKEFIPYMNEIFNDLWKV